MEFIHSPIKDLVEIIPRIFEDERGIFFESYHKPLFAANGVGHDFVQSNQSFSKKGVLRGLHFQRPPFAQGKLVKVVTGKALDVVVDLREDSPTFGQHAKFLLDGRRNNMVYVPEGFAHGFAALEDTILQYQCTNVYHKDSEGGFIWNDSRLGIDWGISNPLVSEKDVRLPTFGELLENESLKFQFG